MSRHLLIILTAVVALGCTSSAPATSTPSPAAATPTPRISPTAPTASPPSTPSVTPTPSSNATPAGEAAWVVQRWNGGRTSVGVYSGEGTWLNTPSDKVPGSNPTNPDWSPDGQQLTFGVTDAGRDDLWIVNHDGSDARRVFDCEEPCDYIDDAAWSPDGASIAVCQMSSTDDGHAGSLVLLNVTTGLPSTVLEPEDDDFCSGPRWSPDGQALVLELVDREGAEIDSPVIGVTLSIIDLSQSPPEVRSLTDAEAFAATADWSAASNQIVYSALANPGDANADLFVINPDGSGLVQVTHLAAEGGATEPSFDSSGTAVVFVGRTGLQRVDLTTGLVEPAFPTTLSGNHPRARPEQQSGR